MMANSSQGNISDWLSTIPFSKPLRNLARDFSDGILTAELIKYFFPKMVDLHNYPKTNALCGKKTNWLTLTNKVLKKLDLPLSSETIDDLTFSRTQAAENFLQILKNIIDVRLGKTNGKISVEEETSEHQNFNEETDVGPINSSSWQEDDIGQQKCSIEELEDEESGEENKSVMWNINISTRNDKSNMFPGMIPDGKDKTSKIIRERTFLRPPPKKLIENLSQDKLDIFEYRARSDTDTRKLLALKIQELMTKEKLIQALRFKIKRLEIQVRLKDARIIRQQQLMEEMLRSNHSSEQSPVKQMTGKRVHFQL